MAGETCPFCSTVLRYKQLSEGWCDDCGKRLPPSLSRAHEGSRFADASRTAEGPASWWSAPVDERKRPAVRWIVQMISGLLLVLLFGGMQAVIVLLAKGGDPMGLVCSLSFGPLVGLPMAAAVNGLVVGMRGRRLS